MQRTHTALNQIDSEGETLDDIIWRLIEGVKEGEDNNAQESEVEISPKIIKVFENKEAEELPFEAIFDAVGGKATVVGVFVYLTPGVFSKIRRAKTKLNGV